MNYIQHIKDKFPDLAGKVSESPKMWYQGFPYKISIDVKISPTTIWFWLGATYGMNTDTSPKGNAPFRVKGGYGYSNSSLFLKTMDDVDRALAFFDKHITGIMVTPNDKTTELLKSNEKIRLKKKLYFGKYRFKVTLRYNKKYLEDKSDIEEWVRETFNIPPTRDNYYGRMQNDSIWFRSHLDKPNIFFAEEHDLTLLKLTWSEYIDSIEIIKLISEVE